MTSPAFIVTIDTEGDNIWARPEQVTTENARFLPRFQNLCEEFGFKVTYLVNHEMALDPRFQTLGRSVLKRETAEIGLHVHAWDSPPLTGERGSKRDHSYLFEFPDELIRAKIGHMDDLLTNVFEVRPVSHRAGRWGFNERIAGVLAEMGYLVDCSVTPGVDWSRYKGSANGNGGPNYYGFPSRPYFLDLSNIRRGGNSQLLEVPVTIRQNYSQLIDRVHRSIKDTLAGKVLRRAVGPPAAWLRPTGRNLESMLSLVDWAVQENFDVLEFMLHSSELMPAGSPTFRTDEQVEVLYEHLTTLFRRLKVVGARGMTLAEYRSEAEPKKDSDSASFPVESEEVGCSVY